MFTDYSARLYVDKKCLTKFSELRHLVVKLQTQNNKSFFEIVQMTNFFTIVKNQRPRITMHFFCFLVFVCFSNPTSPPRSSICLFPCLVQCVPAYTLSSPALKGVTRRMDFKHNPTDASPFPALVGFNIGRLDPSQLIIQSQ